MAFKDWEIGRYRHRLKIFLAVVLSIATMAIGGGLNCPRRSNTTG